MNSGNVKQYYSYWRTLRDSVALEIESRKITDNYQICEKMLFALLRRLRNSPKLLKEYDDAIRELAVEGIIEEILLCKNSKWLDSTEIGTWTKSCTGNLKISVPTTDDPWNDHAHAPPHKSEAA